MTNPISGYSVCLLHPSPELNISSYKLLFEFLLTDIKHPPQSSHPYQDSLSLFHSWSGRVVFHYGVSTCSKYGAPQTADPG